MSPTILLQLEMGQERLHLWGVLLVVDESDRAQYSPSLPFRLMQRFVPLSTRSPMPTAASQPACIPLHSAVGPSRWRLGGPSPSSRSQRRPTVPSLAAQATQLRNDVVEYAQKIEGLTAKVHRCDPLSEEDFACGVASGDAAAPTGGTPASDDFFPVQISAKSAKEDGNDGDDQSVVCAASGSGRAGGGSGHAAPTGLCGAAEPALSRRGWTEAVGVGPADTPKGGLPFARTHAPLPLPP